MLGEEKLGGLHGARRASPKEESVFRVKSEHAIGSGLGTVTVVSGRGG